ncbi:MAG: Fic family protein, partial [Selenomonadaceae bacterium]|nr:Fic family protein [Selenomonadaceae bacterium]
LYGLVKNHAFIDGNKRIAVHAAEVFLIINEVNMDYFVDDMEKLVMGIASDELGFEDALLFIREHT